VAPTQRAFGVTSTSSSSPDPGTGSDVHTGTQVRNAYATPGMTAGALTLATRAGFATQVSSSKSPS
jgi:hypothetical protein